MKYLNFKIKNYKAITNEISISFDKLMIAPIIGVRQSGKSSVLEAFFAFDFRNDKYDRCQFNNIKNISSNISLEKSILCAEIELNYTILLDAVFSLLLKKYKKQLYLNLKKHAIYLNTDNFSTLIQRQKKEIRLLIKRNIFENIQNNFYEINNFTDLKIHIQSSQNTPTQNISMKELLNNIPTRDICNQVAKNIINTLPKTVYFNDFNESFIVKKIDLTSSIALNNADDWYFIFKNIFQLHDICIEKVSKQDLNKINNYLNNIINHNWEQFGIGSRENYRIDLTYQHDILIINFLNTVNNIDFTVCQLSKTFNWYINFLFRFLFLYKSNSNNFNIYLFDEPGIYLSAYDQYKLCKNISFLAKENYVVYTSQSHQLFNLQYIQLKSILLLSKHPNKDITLKYLRDSKSLRHVDRNLMMQSIFEVLNLDNLDYFFAIDRPILLVEGMADKFYLDIFLNEDILNKFFIVASQGASSLVKNVQYFVSFNKKFIVLSDFDKAGVHGLEECIEKYQTYKKGAFLHLPKINGDESVVIEDMLSNETRNYIIKTLNLKKDVYKKSIIFTLVRSKDDKIQNVKNNISKETSKNFNILATMLERELKIISKQALV